MISTIRSHQLNILAERLAAGLEELPPDDPFQPLKIIIPNLDTARWLKLFLAGQNGFVGNLEFMLPAEWQWKQVRKLYPDLPNLLPSDLQPMKWSLFDLLMNPESRSGFSILDRYVSAQPDEMKERAALQLAGQIASVFDQYLVYRPEMMLRWQNGSKGKGDEQWQSDLWRELNRNWKESDPESLNKPELFRKTFDAVKRGEINTDTLLFVFNAGLIPLPAVQMLKETGRQGTLMVYHLQLSRSLQENQNELIHSLGTEALNSQAVIQFFEGSIEEDFSDGFTDSLLGSIQRSVVSGSSLSSIRHKNGFHGIEIRSCHSPLREIETLHQFLLEQFETDESLAPDDVLIVTPDPENYKPFIRAVFKNPEQGQPEIPFHLSGSLSAASGFEQALHQLLQVLDSRFSFSQVMDLFHVSAVRNAFGVSESAASRVSEWMQENHVVWGLDEDHREEWGQPRDSFQTWYSALRSGWLGQWTGGENGIADDGTLLYNGIINTSDSEIWAAFSGYLNRLDQMRIQARQKRNVPGWCGWLEGWLNRFFPDEIAAGSDALQTVQVLHDLAEYGAISGCDLEVSFPLFRSELEKCKEQTGSSGAMFTRGVTFSSMVPVRSIPFRIIALIGLNENEFPRKPSSPDFDLIGQFPKTGDRNRKHEDRNLFLESVLAAGDVHYCSYVGQSPVDNEEIPPSAVISEWAGFLSELTGVKEKEIIKKEALNGFSLSGFTDSVSYSRTYFETAQTLFTKKESVEGLKLTGPVPPAEESEHMLISDLARFFKSPVDWFFKKRFEVYFDDSGEEKDEFGMNHLESHILFQRVFGWVLNGMADNQIQNLLIKSGAVPSGWPGIRKVNAIRDHAVAAINYLNEFGIQPEMIRKEISIALNNNQLEDSVVTYSNSGFLDITPSSYSGKHAVQSWVRYVCWVVSGREGADQSYFLCELKKGDPKFFRFKKPDDSAGLLSALLEFYQAGLAEPQLFFPGTLAEYEEYQKTKGEDAALAKARNTFEGVFKSFGERENRSVQTLLGAEARFSLGFLNEPYLAVIRQMQKHMEVVK
jgi:exodeoxyribonuclease V gamma subunit